MSHLMCMPGLDGKQACVEHEPPRPAPHVPPKLAGMLSSIVDLKEQVVGSDHAFTIGELHVEHGMALISMNVQPSVDPSSAFRESLGLDPSAVLRARAGAFSAEHRTMMPLSSVPRAIRVRFSPRDAGYYQAELVLIAQYSDRRVEKRVVELRAHARKIEQLPRAEILEEKPRPFVESLAGDAAPATVAPPPVWSEEREKLAESAGNAKDAVGGVARQQVEGVGVAEQQAMSYRERPPETSLLQELAELALSIGVAGIAGAIAAKLAPKLAGLIIKKPVAEGSPLVTGIGEGIQEGIGGLAQDFGGGLVEIVRGSSAAHGGSEEAANERLSTNRRIAFFAKQRAMLLGVETENEKLVERTHERLKPLLATNPDLAVGAMDGLRQVLEGARDHYAMLIQARASERQWVSLVAQENLGSEVISNPTTERQRSVAKAHDATAKTRGVLTIEVAATGSDSISSVRVKAASIRGISQEIADELRTQPLLNAGIPIRLKVEGKDRSWYGGQVTRDEGGRVRVSGFIPHEVRADLADGRPPLVEAQMIANAEALCGQVLAKSLADWGVEEVTTDDESGRGDPR